MSDAKHPWLVEFLLLRDRRQNSSNAYSSRLRAGGRVHLYTALSSRHPVEAWTSGHIRAALLSAARDDSCLTVEVLMRTAERTHAAHMLATLRKSLETETGLYMAEWRVLIDAQREMKLRSSLYTAVEMSFFSDMRLQRPLARR